MPGGYSKGDTRPPMRFILLILGLDVLGIGLAIPVMPTLIATIWPSSAEHVSSALGVALTLYSAMQFLCAPLLGALSDCHGRRPILLLALAGMCLGNLMAGFAGSLTVLLIGRAIAGITAANIATAMAYIADISEGEQRTHFYGAAGSVIAIALVFGPVIGGGLASYGPHLPFLVAGGLAAINLLYGYMRLPESLAAEHRRAFEWRRTNPFGSLRGLWSTQGLRPYLLAATCSWFAYGIFQSCFVLANQMRYGWSMLEVSYALAALALGMAFAQRVLVRKLTPIMSNQRIIVTGYACCLLGYGFYTAAASVWLTVVGMCFHAVGLIAEPALRSELSRHARAGHQGELQGGLTSLLSLVGGLAPVIGALIFAGNLGSGQHVLWLGAPFVVSLLMYVLAIGCIQRGRTSAACNG